MSNEFFKDPKQPDGSYVLDGPEENPFKSLATSEPVAACNHPAGDCHEYGIMAERDRLAAELAEAQASLRQMESLHTNCHLTTSRTCASWPT